MKKIIVFVILAFITMGAYAQGCVALRSTGGYCSMQHAEHSKWQLNVTGRYFESFRHFVGKEEQEEREKAGTEVINHQFLLDFAITRNINSRWSVMLDVPIISNTRSSLYEHQNLGRFTTRSFGLGDMRTAVYAWVFDAEKSHKGNLQIGAGIKLPTGSYNYQDYFQLTDTSRRLGPVDQSIQLGDGGTGLTLELNGYYNIIDMLGVYGNFYYLSNPREQNGVSTARGGTPSANNILNRSEVMSVPDQYMARAGVSVKAKNITLSGGLRVEAIPVYDIIGGSNGFRRPGRIVTVEPGVTYTLPKVSIFAFVPAAVSRNRTQSVPDRLATKRTGRYTQGDAAFADYSVNVGAAFKF
jgi:hypothetical protein